MRIINAPEVLGGILQGGRTPLPPLQFPAFSTPPSISGSTASGATLTGNDGVITNGGTVSQREWLADDVVIAGETTTSLTTTSGHIGAYITYRVTATNADGSVVATSAAVGPITDTIVTPILTQSSAVNDPLIPNFTNIPSTEIYIQLQMAGAADFTTPLSGEGAIRDEEVFVPMTARNEGIVFTILSNQPSGAVHMRARYRRDDGLLSDWSNVLNDTVVTETASQLDAASKYSQITLSNLNLTAHGGTANVGAARGVRSDNSREGKRYFSVTCDSLPFASMYVGVGNSSLSMTTNFVTANGSYINHGGQIYDTGGFDQTGTGYTATDRIHVAYDTATQKIWYQVNSGGWMNGDPAAGTGGSTLPTGPLFATIWLTSRSSGGEQQATIDFNARAETPTGFTAFT